MKTKLTIDLQGLKGIVLGAGQLIRDANAAMWETAINNLGETTKADGTPITVLDQEINARFASFARRQGIGFVGEEGNGDVDRRTILLVDPIDGTGAFALGMNTATVIVTVMEMDGATGTPVYSIIYEPLRDVMWVGQKGQQTRVLTGRFNMRYPTIPTPLPQSVPSLWKTNICVFPNAGYKLAAVKAAIEADGRFSQQDMGAFGISAGLIASGILHAAAIAPTSAVESAAMSLIVKGAGGVAIDLNGISLTTFALGKDRKGKVDFMLPHGALFASNPEVAEAIIDVVAGQAASQ